MSALPGRNRRLVLAERPSGMVDGKTVRLEEVAAPEPGPAEAVAEFLAEPEGSCFEVDRSREKFLMTFAPGGLLRRVR